MAFDLLNVRDEVSQARSCLAHQAVQLPALGNSVVTAQTVATRAVRLVPVITIHVS